MTSHDGWGAPFHDVVAWGQIFCLRAEALGGGSPGAFPFAWLSQLGDVPRPGGPTNGAGKALIQQLKSAIPCPVGLGPMPVELTHQEICSLSQWMPRSTADLTKCLLRYSSNEMPFITSSRELQASRTSCKYADLSRAIDRFFRLISPAKTLLFTAPFITKSTSVWKIALNASRATRKTRKTRKRLVISNGPNPTRRSISLSPGMKSSLKAEPKTNKRSIRYRWHAAAISSSFSSTRPEMTHLLAPL